MGVIVDTSVLIAVERGTYSMESLVGRVYYDEAGVSAITMSQLLHGAHRARDLGERTRRLALAEAMLDGLSIYEFGPREAQRHAELWAHLQRAGTPIGPHDMLIAATALARGHDVLTLNRAEFARVPGLRLVDVAGP